jgi:hypothetical protein
MCSRCEPGPAAWQFRGVGSTLPRPSHRVLLPRPVQRTLGCSRLQQQWRWDRCRSANRGRGSECIAPDSPIRYGAQVAGAKLFFEGDMVRGAQAGAPGPKLIAPVGSLKAANLSVSVHFSRSLPSMGPAPNRPQFRIGFTITPGAAVLPSPSPQHAQAQVHRLPPRATRASSTSRRPTTSGSTISGRVSG